MVCPAFVASAIYNKGIDGIARGELKVPAEAYPADKTAAYTLDRVAEKQGIIIVPVDWRTTGVWKGLYTGDKKAEEFLLSMAHDRRVEYEKAGL